MTPSNSTEFRELAESLRKYEPKATVTRVAALLTVPSLQANTFRIKTLVHLAAASCRGNLMPEIREIGNWLNRELGNTEVTSSEDPPDDVFVSNVETREGNRRLFEGNWSSNDYFTQIVIQTLSDPAAPRNIAELLNPVFALLSISECVAERVELARWQAQPSTPGGMVELPTEKEMVIRARSVAFTDSDLEQLHINRDLLIPFLNRDEDRQALMTESIWNSPLDRRPLMDFGENVVLALPQAVMPAIIRFVLEELLDTGYLPSFTDTLHEIQFQQIQQHALLELQGRAVPIKSPELEGPVPSLHSLLLKHDVERYLHIVFLHDRLDLLLTQGLSSFMRYPEMVERRLVAHLEKVADHCSNGLGCTDGTTLLVLGGLGRNFTLRFHHSPNQRDFSVIGVSDLLMLASEPGRPLTSYIKFLRQKKWAESEGVVFFSIGGDYNHYSYWRQSRYQLIPQSLSPSPGVTLLVPNGHMAQVREEIRKLTDRHVVQSAKGSHWPVRRFHDEQYFKTMRQRPIYASLPHLASGVLAGVVETTRGPSWLIVKAMKGHAMRRRFQSEIWRRFIDLYDRLVFETENVFPITFSGPLEVYLDLDDVLAPDEYLQHEQDTVAVDPEVAILNSQRAAVIKFPPNFLLHFRQPENKGEKWVLRSFAKALVGLHQGVSGDINEGIHEYLTDKVITDSGLRVFHVFDLYDPVQHLEEKQSEAPTFLSPEDYAFSQLKLSEGCVPEGNKTTIISKYECNKFLHAVVDKLWRQLRLQLKQLNRTSVVREFLRVHEAVLHDRDHWRRTAQALLALYSAEENVFAVAQERENDRIHAALSARSLLEMAICECPEEGGRELSRANLDELVAITGLLLQAAAESDAVHDGLVKPRIELHPNGEYSMERGFRDAVVQPFLAVLDREGFESAARNYSELYQAKPFEEGRRASNLYSSALVSAFHAEYGLKLDDAVDGLAELLSLAVEHDSVVIETTLGVVKNRLVSACGFSPETCAAFMRTFAIFHRRDWSKPPQGFVMRDIEPWRFSRRLALVGRPLLIFGGQDLDKVLFGVGTLRLGVGYLLDRIEDGHLPQRFFGSEEMRRFIGSVNNDKGHTFARSVAAALRDNGWQTRIEIRMSELGAPTELGDVDVLAWKPNGQIRIVECKRLQLARNFSEIAEICRRFRGEAKDELNKHLSRVAWIMNNPGGLQPVVGFPPNPDLIDDRLVTNTHVPMTYLTSLPTDPSKIGPLDDAIEKAEDIIARYRNALRVLAR